MNKKVYLKGYMEKTGRRRAGNLFGFLSGAIGPAATLIALGAVAPGLMGAGAGYLTGRYAKTTYPGLMSKDLQLERTKQLRERLKFRQAQREYSEEAGKGQQEPKEMRIT